METIVIKGRGIVLGVAEGQALVTSQSISPWGGIDASSGTITERRHELRGESFSNKILVFPSAKGSSGFSTVMQVARLLGKAPLAMVLKTVNSLTAMGAIVTRVPTVTDLESDPCEIIDTGDFVRVNADEGLVEVWKK